jgi:hypothetical protein
LKKDLKKRHEKKAATGMMPGSGASLWEEADTGLPAD